MLSRIRNIGIAAHVDAGKTTLTERILFFTGRIRNTGEVHDGAATMDHQAEERQRGITITSAATFTQWERHQQAYTLNIIDTPGHVDFTIEVERSLRVLDGAVAVLDASQGVEPQTETVWRQADRYNVPRVIFVNKLDKVGADFAACLQDLRDKLGVCPLPVQWPVLNEQQQPVGVLDLVTEQYAPFDAAVQPIPTELQALATSKRQALLEVVAEMDEAVLDLYLSGQPVSIEVLQAAIRQATLGLQGFPVLCGAALRDIGVQPLLDAVVDYLPSPADLPPLSVTLPDGQQSEQITKETGAPIALAFKTVADSFGTLTFVRVYSGVLEAGSALLNAVNGERERAAHLVRVHADQTEETPKLTTGEIGAIRNLKHTQTGQTLVGQNEVPVLLESLTIPDPVLSRTVETTRRDQQPKLLTALARAASEDPTLQLSSDLESGLPLLAGMGELHLEVVLNRIARESGLELRFGQPSVTYRETITAEATATYLLKKQSGGSGQYAQVAVQVKPLAAGAGTEVNNAVVGGSIPSQYINACLRGIRDSLQSGPHGHEVVDVQITLLGGKAHSNDSSDLAFQGAAASAVQQALKQAQAVCLEPIMRVDVTTPDIFTGTVVGDLNRRMGQLQGMESRGNAQEITALVPLAKMFGYATDVRSVTQGRANFAMSFDHYAPA